MNGVSLDDLLWSKLYVPMPRQDLVARPRLIGRLSEGLTRPLTLICAPAGYGKSTLLSYWLSQTQIPTAWLSLDKLDNDPIRFWTYIIAALQTVQADLGQTMLDALHSLQPPPVMSVLPGLLTQINAHGAPLILVLDDYQFITERAVHELLAFCLDHLPQQLHIVISTRTDPPFPLARFRVRNQLTELRATDLRFDTGEAVTFLNQMTGLMLSSEDVAALEARTEGWIAGLQLAALSMRGRHDIAAFVKAFTGSHVYVAEYLVEEVLQHQPEEVQLFLLQTAILERLNAGLCEAVTGRQDGQAILMTLQHANLFVIPLDDEAEWFRYHHLFADLLRSRLRQTVSADLFVTLHARAAAWFEQHGLLIEALEHALAGKDYERATALIERIARPMIFKGRINTMKSWLDALPENIFQTSPHLEIYRVWLSVIQGKLDISEQVMQATTAKLSALPPSPDNEKLRLEWIVLSSRFMALAGNTVQAISFAQEALTALPDDDLASRARVHSTLTIAYGIQGDLEKAESAYRECLRLALPVGYYSLAAHTTMVMAMGMSQHYGQLREAVSAYQSIIDMGNQAGPGVFLPAGQGYIGLAEVYLEWHDLDIAEDYLKQGMALCSQAGLAGLSTGYAIESRLRQAKGDFDGALEAIHLIEQVTIGNDFTAAIRQIQVRLAMGDVEGASRYATPFIAMLRDESTVIRVPMLFLEMIEALIARVYIAQSEIDKAMQIVDRIQTTAESGQRVSRLIDVHLLRALAQQNKGIFTSAALDCFEQALNLAEPEGYILLFLEEGQAVIPLLEAVITQPSMPNRLKKYARTLLNAFPEQRNAVTPSSPDLVESLTSRELEVLHLIAVGDSNRTIADKLVITVSAVKKHTGNIFGKLNVNSRTQAVARAQHLGLLPSDG